MGYHTTTPIPQGGITNFFYEIFSRFDVLYDLFYFPGCPGHPGNPGLWSLTPFHRNPESSDWRYKPCNHNGINYLAFFYL
jgi:hypothetical protein